MKSILLEIQETVMKYAKIMSKISGVEVEVVDENLFRVAGTGIFAEHINENMSPEGYVYNHVLQTGSPEIIYNPGREEICINCPNRNDCKEEIEISMPLILGEQTIGVIGIVGSSKVQKEKILSDEKMYLDLLSQIAEFIVVKAAEVIEMKKRATLLETLDLIMNHIERGIIIIGQDDIITMVNDSAKDKLSMNMLEGQHLTIKPTGDSLNNYNEYIIVLQGKKYYVMGDLYDLNREPHRYSKVLIFDSTRDLQEKYYNFTSTVNTLNTSNIIGISEKTMQLRQEIKKIAKSNSTVLITGESGTGKEMVATAIWQAGDRRNNRFIAINCGAIPEPLLESELFGYVKGAFTGADPNGRMGKFELANKGVIFLDEIGDMPLYLQVKLLRVLQERRIVRIGSNQVIPIDVRVIAATNKDLKEMMAKNKFREDLYYRLNVIPLKIASLRERPEDIKELVNLFAERYAKLFGKKLWKISEETLDILCKYPWFGNVRELENTVEFMINMMEDDGILDVNTLPENIIAEAHKKDDKFSIVSSQIQGVQPLKTLEYNEILKALSLFGNDTEGKKKAANALGIGIATLYRKIDALNDNKLSK